MSGGALSEATNPAFKAPNPLRLLWSVHQLRPCAPPTAPQATVPVSAAISNAVFDAVGVRLRSFLRRIELSTLSDVENVVLAPVPGTSRSRGHHGRIRVKAAGAEASVVSVSQTHFDFQQALAESSSFNVIQTFWAFSLGNLVDFLAGRELGYRCDFTSSDLRAELEINAPRERVYAALVDSDQISAWFDYPVGIEPWVGGRFAMGGLDEPLRDQLGGTARIVALEPGRKMSVDFGDGGVSTWELEDSQARHGSPLSRVGSARQGRRTPRGSARWRHYSRCGATWRSQTGSPSTWP